MLQPHQLEIMAYDPFLSGDSADKLGITLCSLEDIFSKCQTISNHLANNNQTVGMLNYSLFSLMSDTATFINTGRGAQVVEEDLVRVLKEKPHITAVLDVTYPEPPQKGHEFYKLPNVFLTPHISGSTGKEVERLAEYMLSEFRRVLNNEKPLYEVTLDMLKTMA